VGENFVQTIQGRYHLRLWTVESGRDTTGVQDGSLECYHMLLCY